MTTRTLVLSEALAAEEFYNRFRGRLHYDDYDDDDEVSWIVNGVVPGLTNPAYPPDAYAPGGYVSDNFVLTKIRALILELTHDADVETKIRTQSYAFSRGVFAICCEDPRFALPPRRNDPFPFRLADAVCERNFDKVKELLAPPPRVRERMQAEADAQRHYAADQRRTR
jgi:hypothetical protein